MLGWEFPPHFAGGVGIVCYELTQALMAKYKDLEITYIMPYGVKSSEVRSGVNLKFANKFSNLKSLSDKYNFYNSKLNVKEVDTLMYCYDSSESYSERFDDILKTNVSGMKGGMRNDIENADSKSIKEIYGGNLIEEVYLYAQRVLRLCAEDDFDVIHAHDWTTIPAAILLKQLTGKPIVLHVHITEFNKTGGAEGHGDVLSIEKLGFQFADKIICVSDQIGNMVVDKYGADRSKVVTIHNGGASDIKKSLVKTFQMSKHDKVVLYAGRMTLQKGPEYFLRAAKKVLEYEPHTKFVMIGSGDMLSRMIELSADLGISKSVLFHGFYSREEADMFFSMADIFVMPSVLEPFGIVPLEAIAKGTPTIISNQSGIAEVLQNTFKVNFWDIDEMAHKILALIKYEVLHAHMTKLGFDEFDSFNWEGRAEKVFNVYNDVI